MHLHLGAIGGALMGFPDRSRRHLQYTVPGRRGAYDELYNYAKARPGFILQRVADAFTVQIADNNTEPSTLVFGLIGLYLSIELGLSGREVQRIHMRIARRKRDWPILSLPETRGSITVAQVMAAAPGLERDEAINKWCRSVWTAFDHDRETIIALLQEYSLT